MATCKPGDGLGFSGYSSGGIIGVGNGGMLVGDTTELSSGVVAAVDVVWLGIAVADLGQEIAVGIAVVAL
ncbi:MAG: hypothetical protein ACPG32_14990 [Akkermansiaceae bacterium]